MIWLIIYLIGVFATMVLCASIELEESNFRAVLVSVVWPLLLVYFAMTLIKDHYERKKNMGEVSDGYHTFNELYEYRLLYNAAFFNELAKRCGTKIKKICFGVMNTATGQHASL